MCRHEVRSTIMTSNRPLAERGKLLGDVPAAGAILDRFLQHAQVVTMAVDKGARWASDIAKELEASSFGILCVTPANPGAPWLNFEAGALSKSVDRARVCPFLFGMKRSEIPPNHPLLQFQSTIYEKEDVRKLVLTINVAAPEQQRLDEQLLDDIFEVWWPRLQNKLDPLVQEAGEASTAGDSGVGATAAGEHYQGMLEEILELARGQQKLLRSPEEILPPEYLVTALRGTGVAGLEPGHPVWVDLAEAWMRTQAFVSEMSDEPLSPDMVRDLIQRLRQPVEYIVEHTGRRFGRRRLR